MHKRLLSFLLLLISATAFAQNGLEGIVVEEYYVSNAHDTTVNAAGGVLPVGSVTYRIYADMLPGYKFQAAYGVPMHELRIATSTTFFNNEDRGATSPTFTKTQAAHNTVMLDSWLSVGAACSGNFGVMKTEDNGVANVVNSDGVLQNNDPSAGIPLTTQDGLLAGAPEVVTTIGIASEIAVFNNTNTGGNLFSTFNGSWASLNGSTGPTSTNKVLIAQITTNGCLSFELNLQVGTPSGGVQNYVAKNPTGNEIQLPSLTYNTAGVSIAASPAGSICAGTNVTFTATTINGGASPSYQWKLNGSNAGINSSAYSSTTLSDNDQVACIMTSNAGCVAGNPATSNTITMSVAPAVPVISSLSPAQGSIGTLVTITGSGFTGATDVKFNGVSSLFSVVSPTQLTATVPSGAVAGSVKVTNACGTAISPSQFVVQGLENIIVEKYYVSNTQDTTVSATGGVLPVGSITYRIYADMLPGYKFQAAYGVPAHELRIATTTSFFNNEDRGNTTPSYTKAQASHNTVMLDSWLSVGAACSGNFGVMKSEDDGVSTVVNTDGVLQNNDPSAGIPLTSQDGLLAGAPEVVTTIGITGPIAVFNNTNTGGNVFSTLNGSWASLNGSSGPTSSNRVLIAQITTNGCLSFELNVQIGAPGGGVQNYVARNPSGNEIQLPGLIFNTAAVTITASPSGNICAGANATFTAIPVNGGTAPSYQWKRNSANVGTDNPSYSTTSLADNDLVSCVMTSNASCAAGNPAASNTFTASVTPAIPVITSLSPASATTGASMTITGTGFSRTTDVKFNGTAAAFSVVTPTQIIATVPSGSTTGFVKVTNSCGTGISSTQFVVQGLENIIVEKYYISNANDTTVNSAGGNLPVGSVTYRIYADMLPGYKFQAAYGIPGHELRISTSSTFFNNEDRGSTFPTYTKAQASHNTVMLDSWLSVGAACSGNFGVLKSEDNGAATVVNTDGVLQNNDPSAGIPLTVQDGLLAGVPEAVTTVGITNDISIFNNVTGAGSLFSTSNGSWASLNGAVGPTASNRVLIAQITTDGCFGFELNIQIGTPAGGTQNYVASNPVGNEIQLPSLSYGFARPVSLNLKTFIEGFYKGGGMMKAVLDPVNHPDLCDSITVELHEPAGTYNLAYTSRGI